jgi:hypothetical protein
MKLIPRRLLPVLIFLFSLSVIACNNGTTATSTESASKTDSSEKTSSTPAVFEMLLGTWKRDDGKLFERWTKNDNGTYTSVVYTLTGRDTNWKETASIYPETDKWVYENLVTGQNAGKSTKFTSSSITSNSVQFSNPAHDFPTDVNYTLPDANTVNAFIVGPNEKGGKDTIPFNYVREK